MVSTRTRRVTLPPAEVTSSGAPAVSVIVAVTERSEPLDLLYAELAPALRASGRTFEFIFAAVNLDDASREPLLALARAGEPVRVLEGGPAVGEAALVRAAAARSRGEIILSHPAYPRVEAEALPELVAAVEGGADLAVARRWPRRDSWINQLQNRVLHRLLGGLTRGRIHDVACGVRAMRPELLREIPLYGDFFRFLPLLAVREGYTVEEITAPQHSRDKGPRVYSPGVYLRRLLDIAGLFFLLRFTEKPLRFFGMIGSLLSILGVVILGFGVFERLIGRQGLADRPLLLFGVLALVVGVQAFALGLIGEIIVHVQARRTPTYRLRKSQDQNA
ncbi:glycosyltransferase [soil metagenome]